MPKFFRFFRRREIAVVDVVGRVRLYTITPADDISEGIRRYHAERG